MSAPKAGAWPRFTSISDPTERLAYQVSPTRRDSLIRVYGTSRTWSEHVTSNLGRSAGSVLLFNGALWHSSGANLTARERVCLICFCLRSFLKPQFDFVNYLSDEAYAAATPELRRLYGFTSWPQAADDGALPSRRA